MAEEDWLADVADALEKHEIVWEKSKDIIQYWI
jgi:hypothetical protein